jgi:excisionase family DNA binding protein
VYVSAKEAAALARVHERTICRWARAGKIRVRRIGGVVRIAVGRDNLPIDPATSAEIHHVPATRPCIGCAPRLLELERARDRLELAAFRDPLEELAALDRAA